MIMKTLFNFCMTLFVVSALQAQEALTCADFKEGSFVVPMNEYVSFETLIIRQGDEQREIVDINGNVSEVIVSIIWTSDCSYELHYVSSYNDPEFVDIESVKETVVYVEILKIKDSCAHIIASATIKGEKIQMPGLMCKEELL